MNRFQKLTAYMMIAVLGFGMLALPQGYTVRAADTTSTSATVSAEAQSEMAATGVGVALMSGETTVVSFATATTQYIPITVSKGYLTIERADDEEESVSLSVLEYDKETAYYEEEVLDSGDSTETFAVDSGTYYICLVGTLGTQCKLRAKRTAGLSMKLNKSVTMRLGTHAANAKFYMQFTPSKTGYLSVENMGSADVSVSICSTDKKALSSAKKLTKYSKKNHDDNKTLTGYGVIRGKTYLLCLTAAKSVKKVTLKTALKSSYSSVGGKSYAKSQKLSSNKIYATLGAGGGKSYYTFQKTSYSSKRLYIVTKDLSNQGKIRMQLYYKEVTGPNKGKILAVKTRSGAVTGSIKAETNYFYRIRSNWPKVTYYVVISGADDKSNGGYQIYLK